MRFAWPGRRLAAAGAVSLTVALSLVGAAPATADEQPSILKAYGLDWIERVKEEAWPQPKQQRPIICLLDTGVAITPDTPADDPAGPIVARLALDGGTGLPQGEEFEHLHGTQMASVIAAPRNGWGTVGVFPQARIVSVRVTVEDAIYITPGAVLQGVRSCRRWAASTPGLRIAAFVMAESLYDQRAQDLPWWETAAGDAAQSGAVFVAAAGNSPQAESVGPLAVPSVLTIGAGDGSGARCSFAAPEQSLTLLGPGCAAARAAWPAGSSSATAAVGALIAAETALAPAVPPAAWVARLHATSLAGPDGSARVNGASALELFQDSVATTAPASTAFPGISIDPVSSPGAGTTAAPKLELFRPKVRASWKRGRLVVTRLDRRRAGLLRVALGSKETKTAFQGRGRVLRLPVTKRPSTITVWAESRDGSTWRSLAAHAKVGR